MKYSSSNPPLVCMMTDSTCYKGTSTMVPRGVLVHSTGAPNKTLKRYVQPSKSDVNYNALLAKIGINPNRNDWNNSYQEAGLNAWVGCLANGDVTSIQTMPWNFKPWGCGGNCNNGWIQFEICEDYLNDKNYFMLAYKEACELTAYLCVKYHIDPKGMVSYGGKKVPTVLCHSESYDYGMGSNHGDVMHWFPKFGKTMDTFRNDVAALINGTSETDSTTTTTTSTATNTILLRKGSYGNEVKELQEDLITLGYSCGSYGADGDFGDDTESAVNRFQLANGLEVDGIVGPETLGKIESLLNTKSTNEMYRIRKSWDNVPSQKGAYTILENAKRACDKAGDDYKVFNSAGTVVYPLGEADTTANSSTSGTTTIKPATSYADVMIGHASQDEKGKYNSGAAGDSTGKEVCIRSWYNSNWNLVLRPIDEDIAEKIAVAAENACNNSNVGYDQYQRNTLYTEALKVGLDLSKITTPCECDCSSLVSICCICAGLPESAFYIGGNMRTTYNLKPACASTNKFQILSASKYINQKDYLKRGDILLNESSHTAIVLADGKNVEKNSEKIGNAHFPYIVVITANKLAVRGGPGDNYSQVTTVRRNEAYTILEEEGGYGRLKSGVGWISLAYTEKI